MLLIKILHNLKKRFMVFLAASSHLNYQGRHMGAEQMINHQISCLCLICPPFSQQLLCGCGAFRRSSSHPLQLSPALKMEYQGDRRACLWEMRNTELGPSQDHLKSHGVEIWLSIHQLILPSSNRMPRDSLSWPDRKFSLRDSKSPPKHTNLIQGPCFHTFSWQKEAVCLASKRHYDTKCRVQIALKNKNIF